MHCLRSTMATTSWSLLKKLRRQDPNVFLKAAATRLGNSREPSPSSGIEEQETGQGASGIDGKSTQNYGIGSSNVVGLETFTNSTVQPSSRGSKIDEPAFDLLKINPYFDKYSDKLQKKQLLDPESFDSRLSEIQRERQRFAEQMRQKAAQEQTKKENNSLSLDSILKVDLVKHRTPEEIEMLWNEYHKNKDCIFAVVPRNEYEQICSRAKEFGTFLYPLPRGNGYEFIVQQFEGHRIHFTPLISLQTNRENAAACLTITHYTELMQDKGLVLMKGEPDLKLISVHEAQLLALQVKMYYGLRSGLRFNIVRVMNNSPDEFCHMDLIKEFENLKRDSRDYKDMLASK